MKDYIDKPASTREGEEIDQPRIREYLADSIPGLEGELEIKQFPSGFSNLTYLVKFGKSEMILRRPPAGKKAKTAHDMGREYRMLSALYPVFPYCPKPLAYSEDESVIGSTFYVMERIKGIILRKNLPEGMNLAPGDAGKLCGNLLDLLCALHSVDYKKIGLESFGRPEGYTGRQVTGWSGRYRDARTPDAPDFETVMAWLADKKPADSDRPCLIHNDYKFDNVVLDPDNPLKIVGILDWEMATIGDPLMDLGNSMAYWVEKNDPEQMQLIRMLPTNIDGALTRDELVERYSDKTGIDIKGFDYYYCFGLFRLAVIAQQIYYRYFHGQTKDQRFKTLVFAVKILEDTAKKVIEKSKM
ncbi:MAG: phosphotransferase family protein [Spirochaetes bacterium]|jgi:aminoglycoside phosphotransferase (APT) family kinase protein|nr:phosphotransferase family protein [Spirochaetota bacterium]